MNKPKNLMEGLLEEINRVKEILPYYEEIPQGIFGATVIKDSIKKGEAALVSGNIIDMMCAFDDLKDIQ